MAVAVNDLLVDCYVAEVGILTLCVRKRVRKVRIDEDLIEQIQWYDIFPKGMWSIQARVNYCVSVGLGILLIMFKKEAEERQESGKGFKDDRHKMLGIMTIQNALMKVMDMKLPHSEVARLLSRNLYG